MGASCSPDNFIFVGLEDKASLPPSCQKLVETFHQVCKNLGVPLATAKSVGPTSKLVYLSLKVDSVKKEVSIPEAKINAIILKVKDALQHTKITLNNCSH